MKVSTAPRVVVVDRLADELLIAASSFGGDYPEDGLESRLVSVLLYGLRKLEACDLALPKPRDERLWRITDRLLLDPAQGASLVTLAALTERTAARLLLPDTGLTFGRWRQRMRLQRLLEHLATGESVTQAAFAVVYANVSSFIAAFRSLFGRTPARILEGGAAAMERRMLFDR